MSEQVDRIVELSKQLCKELEELGYPIMSEKIIWIIADVVEDADEPEEEEEEEDEEEPEE